MSSEMGAVPTPTPSYELLANFNHEVANTIYISMPERAGITGTDLSRTVNDNLGDDPTWDISPKLTIYYAGAFAKSGLLEPTVLPFKKRTVEYEYTDTGRTLGLPVAGQLLGLSAETSQSLAEICGHLSTKQPNGAQPFARRISILELLAKNEGSKLRVSHIGKALDMQDSSVSNALNRMADADLINKSSSGRGNSVVVYEVKPEIHDIKLHKLRTSQLYIDVIDVLRSHDIEFRGVPISNADIASLLIDNKGYDDQTPNFVERIGAATYAIANYRKALDAQGVFDVRNERSIVWVSKKQLEVAHKIITVVEGILDPSEEFLHAGRQKAKKLLADPDTLNQLVAKAKAASSGLKTIPSEQTRIINMIRGIVEASQEPTRSQYVQDQLHDAGEVLTIVAVRKHLKKLSAAGVLTASEDKVGSLFSSNGQN